MVRCRLIWQLRTGAQYKLRLPTAQRGEEVAGMRWQDVDLEGGWWTIPSASSKNKLAHRVPLNASALEPLTECRAGVDRASSVSLEMLPPACLNAFA